MLRCPVRVYIPVVGDIYLMKFGDGDERARIAEGQSSCLGIGPVERLSFVVETVRSRLARAACSHDRAEKYCPECGHRAI